MNRDQDDWRPTAALEALRVRARLLGEIRAFFAERDVLEVDTPLLSAGSLAHPETRVLTTTLSRSARQMHLQTSPEAAMKRLLAAMSGPIYQICKAFRDEQDGALHNPEFTILEWYRPGWDHEQLIVEVDELLKRILGTPAGERLRYADVVRMKIGVDPINTNVDVLRQHVLQRSLAGPEEISRLGINGLLEALVKNVIEPGLGHDRPAYLCDFPSAQACLAKVDAVNDVAQRFEVYLRGLELGNGYHELCDPDEHLRRFALENQTRQALGLPELPNDERLLAAVRAGLPDCAGVALGIDRLVMLAVKARSIEEVVAFPVGRA